jgi:hypothetical protein
LDFELWNCKVQSGNCKVRSSKLAVAQLTKLCLGAAALERGRLWTLNFGLRTLDFVFWSCDSGGGLTLDFELLTLNFGL